MAADIPGRAKRGAIRAALAVVLVSALLGASVALATRADSTSSSVVLTLDPFTVETLFDPPGTERDPQEEESAQVTLATSGRVLAAASRESGAGVLLSAAAQPASGTLTLTADAGSRAASMAAAGAAADAYLQLRLDNGTAQADGGVTAVEAGLEQLQARRAEVTDLDQLEAIDTTIGDYEASLAQLRAAQERFAVDRLGAVASGPSDPAADAAWIVRGVAVFLLSVLVLGSVTWAVRRWRGPVRGSRARGVTGLPVAAVLHDDDEAAAYVVELRLAAPSGRAPVLVVTTAPGAEDTDPLAVALHLAGLAARTGAAVVVDGRLTVAEAGGEAPSDLSLASLRLHPDAVPPAVDGQVLVITPGAHPDPAGAVATPHTAAALRALATGVGLVVVVAPPADHLGAVAWSGHADALVLAALEGVTPQSGLRRARRVLHRFSVQPGLLLLEPALLRAPTGPSPRQPAPA